MALLSSPRNRAIAGAVDNAMAAGKDLPNTWYVYGVEGFMTNQPWNS